MEQPEGDGRGNNGQDDRYAQLQAKRAAEMKLRSMLSSVMEPSALERLSRIRMANPELYEKIASVVMYLAQNGQLKSKVTEEQLKQLVSRALEGRRDGTITFSRK